MWKKSEKRELQGRFSYRWSPGSTRTCPAASNGAQTSHLPPPLLLISMLRARYETCKHTPCARTDYTCSKSLVLVGSWTSTVRTNTSRGGAAFMAAELRRADVGVPTTAAHWRESSPARDGIKWRRKPRDKGNGWEVFKRTASSLTRLDCTDLN